MPKLNMAVSHSLTQNEAGKRVKNLLTDLKTEFGENIKHLYEKWDGNVCNFSFSVMSFPVSGTLTVEISQVRLFGNLPLAALPFKGMIESTIRDHTKILLA